VSAQVADHASKPKGVPIRGRTPRLLAAATAVLALCCASAAQGADLSVRASQDTQVDATAPKRSGGTARTLHLTAKPLRRAFMRFDLRKVKATPTAAVLRLYIASRSGGRVRVNAVAPGKRWSEKRTTFKNRPAIAAKAARSKSARAPGWLAIDVTKLIRPGRLSDLAVSGAPRAVVASSESAHRPRLIVKPRGGPPFPPPGPPFPPPGPPFPPPSVPPPFGGAAPAVDVTGVDRTDEGTIQTFNYTVSDPDSIPTVERSCGSNAQLVGQPRPGSFECAFPDGPATSTVSVRADDGSHVGSDQISVAVADVAPVVTAPADQTAATGTSASIDLGSFTDANPDDRPWKVRVDWGDESETFDVNSTGALPRDHAYAADGPHTVTVAVTDRDSGTSDLAHFTVTSTSPTVTVAIDAAPNSPQAFEFTMTHQPGPFTLIDDTDPARAQETFTVGVGELGPTTITGPDVSGWTLSAAPGDSYCDGDSDAVMHAGTRTAEINVDPREQIVCHFRYMEDATVTVVQDATPDSSQSFDFTTTGQQLFSLRDDGTASRTKTLAISAGGFGPKSITQVAYPFWALDDIACSGDPNAQTVVAERRVDLVVSPGEDITCTFSDHRVATTVGGVFPESSSDVRPIEDNSGNLYTVNELAALPHPYPTIKKSTDGGQTWAEVDGTHRPESEDLESVALVKDGQIHDPQHGLVHMLQQQSSMTDPSDNVKHEKVVYHSFWTQNGSGGSDAWQTKDELVASPLGDSATACSNGANCGPYDQAVSLLQRQDSGDLIAIYNTNRAACTPVAPATTCTGAQRIGYKVKPFGGSWGPEQILDSEPGVDFTQAVAVMGDSDVAHVFYKDDTNNRIYYRTLSPSGTLSAASQINANGTDGVDHALVTPVRLHVGSTERIVVAWKRGTGEVLNSVAIDGGVIGAQTQVSAKPVMANPDSVQSRQPVASLAADEIDDKVDIVFAACTVTPCKGSGKGIVDPDRTVYYNALSAGGSWGSDVELLDTSHKVASVQASVLFNANGPIGFPTADSPGRQLGVVFDQETCWDPCTPQVDNTVKYTQISAP
jgi:hypothetical protein